MAYKFDDILQQYRKESKNKLEFGLKFEILIKQFLETDRVYSEKFTKIWIWKKWPKRDKNQDRGIDLIGEIRYGGLCAIQCKAKYDDSDSLNATDMKNFSSMSEQKRFEFTERLLVFSGHKLSGTLIENIEGSRIPYNKILGNTLRSSNVDWSNASKLKLKKPLLQNLHIHQKNAMEKVLKGFADNDRGKLIMACGTGKTLTSLAIALEHLKNKKNCVVLYLVPSIALVQQSYREWANQTNACRFLTVCSDNNVGKNDDLDISDLESRATTNENELRKKIMKKTDKITVIFSTYHSSEVIKNALGSKQIDLVMCDEAHRTATNENYYSMIHDNRHINVKKRLYMTATERIYAEKTKSGNINKDKAPYSMDNVNIFGKTFFEYDFNTAIGDGNLSDFKITVLRIPRKMVVDLYDKSKNEGTLDTTVSPNDFTRMCGVWKAIQYPNGSQNNKKNLLQRVIIFTGTIAESKQIANKSVKHSTKPDTNPPLELVAKWCNKNLEFSNDVVSVDHIDGTMNAAERGDKIQWLKNSAENPNECRVLSNVRCLSEGVDVPALDGIVFLKSKKTQIDIVQAVGRVIRKIEGKKEGHVIIPVVVPDDITSEDGLEKSEWETVYRVCSAMRSHDANFGITDEPRLNVLTAIPPTPDSNIGSQTKNVQKLLLKEDTVLESQVIEKCGDREYYDDYCRKLGMKAYQIRKILQHRIEQSHDTETHIKKFHENVKSILGEHVEITDVVIAISEHIVLSRLFYVLFDNDRFKKHNPLTEAFDDVVENIDLEEMVIDLEEIYKEMEIKLDHIKKSKNVENETQRFIEKLYENFFKGEDNEDAKKHGIVFTPPVIVDFMLNSVQHIIKTNLNIKNGFDDRTIKILDPFAGTGIFLTKLINSNKIIRNLSIKYKNDLYANEIKLLAYYVATTNIENAYMKQKNNYVQFDGTNYTNTFQSVTTMPKLNTIFKPVLEKLKRQRREKINVIIGNPPYNIGKKQMPDEIRTRIRDTYVKRSIKSGAMNSLTNAYIMALRWASDRIGSTGIIAFVIPSNFLRSTSTSGVRACLEDEFTNMWFFDLRGDQQGSKGETVYREGGKIFGSGSRQAIVLAILVKNSNKKSCVINYKDIGDNHNTKEKLTIIENVKSIEGIKNWKRIHPDKYHDWFNQRNDEFKEHIPLCNDETRKGNNGNAIFKIYSQGFTSARDAWAYNSNIDELKSNMKKHIDYCNSIDLRLEKNIILQNHDPTKGHLENGKLVDRLKKMSKKPVYDASKIRTSLYRSFFKQYLYYSKPFFATENRIPEYFPYEGSENWIICIPYNFIGNFSVFVTNVIPDLHIIEANQCIPLYSYDAHHNKKSNILNSALSKFKEHYKKDITEKEIFYYVYAMLHHKGYREKYHNDLTKEFPHLPFAPNFDSFCDIGKKLVELHLNFDGCKKYPMKYKKFENPIKLELSNNQKILKINGVEAFTNIPSYEYTVNGDTPLKCIVKYHNVFVDKKTDSKIIKTPMRDMAKNDLVDKIQRAVYLGIESDKLINSLPIEFQSKEYFISVRQSKLLK